MSVEDKTVILASLKSEIAAFEVDLKDTPPAKDFEGKPLHIIDQRVAYLAKLNSAVRAVSALAPSAKAGAR